jgi:hypothetical protein
MFVRQSSGSRQAVVSRRNKIRLFHGKITMPIYHFTNESTHYKTVAIRDFRFAFEKVVRPNESISFPSLPHVLVEVCSIQRVTAIYCDTMSCKCLAQGDE